MRYKVNVRFTGAAGVEVDADSPAEAREIVLQMNIADLARPTISDVYQLEVAAREITVASSLTQGHDEEEAQNKPRPSGWYRPG